jgi:hypothetical protein
MHSFLTAMPSNEVVTMPLGSGAIGVYTQKTITIHLFIHQINSL